MHEFKAGELHRGKTDTIVTTPKQAIAIALSEADELKKNKKMIKNYYFLVAGIFGIFFLLHLHGMDKLIFPHLLMLIQ